MKVSKPIIDFKLVFQTDNRFVPKTDINIPNYSRVSA